MIVRTNRPGSRMGQPRTWIVSGLMLMVSLFSLGQQNTPSSQPVASRSNAKQYDDRGSVGRDVPVSREEEYIVGEGDLLRINVWKEPEVSQNVAVRPDGNITLPLVNEIRVSGLSPKQIQQLVTEKLTSVLTNPQVTVTVVEVRSKMVYITGEVGKPGAYPVIAPMNVLQLIARAGGLNEFANRKEIYVLRAGNQQIRLRFNYKEVVKGRNPEQNIILQSGDTVVVP
ncbi:MAG TPA: polysaccharide biosynthesis/export family protein [Candidatus Angelobacter sp.]|nr:polysaccharide biosynthesis/export family protein [Candidatus Angelobacter sp.]